MTRNVGYFIVKKCVRVSFLPFKICLTAENFNQWQANLLKFEFNPFDGKSVYTMTNAEYDHITYLTSLSLHFLTTNNLSDILIKMTWEFMQPVNFFFMLLFT